MPPALKSPKPTKDTKSREQDVRASALRSRPSAVSAFRVSPSALPAVSADASVSDAIVAYFVDAAALLGVPKSVAAIYGICFASPEPLSFSDIQARLDLSAGSISQGLKLLREVGALKIVGDGKPETGNLKPDSQVLQVSGPKFPVSARASAARYAPDLELRKLAQHFLAKRVQPQLASGRDRLAQILTSVAAGPVRARLEHLSNWHAKADALLPLAAAFLNAT